MSRYLNLIEKAAERRPVEDGWVISGSKVWEEPVSGVRVRLGGGVVGVQGGRPGRD